jgi:hypothetical protein
MIIPAKEVRSQLVAKSASMISDTTNEVSA